MTMFKVLPRLHLNFFFLREREGIVSYLSFSAAFFKLMISVVAVNVTDPVMDISTRLVAHPCFAQKFGGPQIRTHFQVPWELGIVARGWIHEHPHKVHCESSPLPGFLKS